MTLKMLNSTPFPKTIRSHSGNSAVLPAKTVSLVDDEFDWIIPTGVKILERITDKQLSGPVTPSEAPVVTEEPAPVVMNLVGVEPSTK